MKMGPTECSETPAHKIQTLRNKPKERIRHSEHSESLKSRSSTYCTGGCVGPRAGLDGCGKSHTTGIRLPDPPARSKSLNQLHYPAHVSIMCQLLMSFQLVWMPERKKKKTSVPTSNQNTIFPSCSTYS